MREYKFRGFGVDGQWWYGELAPPVVRVFSPQGDRHVNLATFFANLTVGAIKPETVGESTGLKDKNGREIYEGDVVRLRTNMLLVVQYANQWARYMLGQPPCGRYCYKYGEEYRDYETYAQILEVIGNIYENPELLKEGAG